MPGRDRPPDGPGAPAPSGPVASARGACGPGGPGGAHVPRGPAPAPAVALGRRDLLLVALSFSAGVVDAISVTALGVFTGAITGDVVLLGISLGRGEPHAAVRAALALAGFAAGVLAATRARRASAAADGTPARRLAAAVLGCVVLLQCLFLAGWLAADGHPGTTARGVLALLSALAMAPRRQRRARCTRPARRRPTSPGR
jgi:Protein of unknown function (DUF1275)